MSRYLLDANHISPLVTRGHYLREQLLRRSADGDQFYIPTLAYAEASYGFLILPRAKQNKRLWEQIQHKFIYLRVFHADVQEATRLRLDLRTQGRQLELIDAIIAITAIRYNLILLTSDRDFEPINHLQTENWRRP